MMKVDKTILTILDRAQAGIAPSKKDCWTMLDYAPISAEAAIIRGVADAVSRHRFGNEAIILGQIGIEIHACRGQCKFCSFGEGHTGFQSTRMSVDEIVATTRDFAQSDDLYALFLMTLHDFEFERLLDTICTIRKVTLDKPQIVVNIGDFDRVQAAELRKAGVDGAYHVCRLREGKDTALDPEQRKRTIKTIKEAGLDWYYCCEPIGPEHTSEELVEQMFLGIEYGCFQHAAMRRVYIPTSPLAHFGQITELRLAQVTAVVALASMGCAETRSIAVHEPNLIGLTSGANVVYAETGANPRDTEQNTSGHRGRDVRECKIMLREAGFGRLLVAPGEFRTIETVIE
jgi:biotin synthase